eukprot:SAG31_NODE_1404_length_8479_cov_2.258760_7_plen_34_part_00
MYRASLTPNGVLVERVTDRAILWSTESLQVNGM